MRQLQPRCDACAEAGAAECHHLGFDLTRPNIVAVGAQIEAASRTGEPATPIEQRLHVAMLAAGLDPKLQHRIGPYIADFAFPDAHIVVEADGRAYHQDADRERRRDAYLRGAGWEVVHFTGTQIHHTADACAHEIRRRVT